MKSEDREVLQGRLTFVPTGQPSIGPIEGSIVASGAGAPENFGKVDRDRRGDWLLLKLDRCVGAKLGFVSLSGEPAKVGTSIMNAGFPLDRPRRVGLSVDPSCRIYYITTNGMLHDCAFLPGNSGGPMFDLGREGSRATLQALAIGSAGYRDQKVLAFDPGKANVATPIAPILPLLRAFLRPVYKGTDSADQFNGSGLFDRLEGGNGSDTFILDKWGGDTILGGGGGDLIVLKAFSGDDHLIADFNPREGDSLDFSSIDADDTLPGIQRFKFQNDTSRPSNGGYITSECVVKQRSTLLRFFVKHLGAKTPNSNYQLRISGCSTGVDGLFGLS